MLNILHIKLIRNILEIRPLREISNKVCQKFPVIYYPILALSQTGRGNFWDTLKVKVKEGASPRCK